MSGKINVPGPSYPVVEGSHFNSSEIFYWSEISIGQHHEVFKIGTDAILLGAWVPKVIVKANDILDAGTGTGILALMMAHAFPDAMITAIDQEAAAISLADYNFKNSLWPDRLFALHQSILDPPTSDHKKFDLILSNPPFFYNQLSAKEGVKSTSKHAVASTQVWMQSLSDKLNPSGHLCIVVPYVSAVDWITAANGIGRYCHHRLNIFSYPDDPVAVRSLLHFHDKLVQPEMERLTIYEGADQYSRSYLEFSKISQRGDRIKNQDQKQ